MKSARRSPICRSRSEGAVKQRNGSRLTFSFSHIKKTRPSVMPAKKPDEMYPADGPPPRNLWTYVTIHPVIR